MMRLIAPSSLASSVGGSVPMAASRRLSPAAVVV
jgi:hypothetical protein